VPAVTAVLDGRWRVGLSPEQESRVLLGTRKVAERDLAVAAAQEWEVGVTTVSASVALAARVGISVFATGGIGGVHRGVELTGDVSADLDALASHPVVTVCAGAKSFLDLPRTLEHLETAGVPVLGWRSPDFPAFYVRSSGLSGAARRAHGRGGGAGAADALARAHRRAAHRADPAGRRARPARHDAALASALAAASAAGITGAAVTPFVLERVGRETEGGSVPANLALAEHNAAVAAQVAAALVQVTA
jgi:pseudouridine-5'-phosphate glycosidase